MNARYARWALLAGALFFVAGCAGSNAPPAATQGVAGAGMPFTVHASSELVRWPAVRPDYPTKKSLVFEANLGDSSVNIYQTADLANNPAPIVTFNSASGCPDGLAMDKKGTLYVADECNGNDIEEFPKGSTTEKTSITGLSNPSGLAMDSHQTLYVSTYPASIEEFAYGSKTPTQTITGQGLTDPFGLAVDKNDNLYIADFGAGTVFELPYGSTTISSLGLQDLAEPLGVAVDEKTGDLWVTNGQGNDITVYQLGNTTPIETISDVGFPYNASAQNKGKPLGTVVTSDESKGIIYAFKSGQYTAYATVTTDVGSPISLLIAKP